MSLHLHGVVRAHHRLPDGSPFRLVELEDLAVLVSDRRADRALTEEEATAHLAALCALVPSGPVLPLRFGTAAVDEDAARTAVLALSVPVLRGHLNRLDGLAEMHVHVVFDEDAALRAVHDEHEFALRDGADLAGTIRQGELIARKIVAWRRGQADGLLAPASAKAREVALLDAREHTEEHRALLVQLGDVEGVRAAIDAIDEVTATCTGPLPAYNFLGAAPGRTEFEPQPTSRWGW